MEEQTELQPQSPPPAEPPKKRGRKTVVLVLCAILLVLLTLLLSRCGAEKSKLQLDADALAGALPGLSAEEIENRLNTIVDEGMFNVSMNTKVEIKDGVGDVRIENIAANHYLMQVDIIVTDAAGAQTTVYSSDLIQPGYNIESAAFDTLPPEGASDALAVFTAFDAETQAEVGKANMQIILLHNMTRDQLTTGEAPANE